MPYIGNTIRAADDYRLIDDISSSFNGSTTSFALQVAGSSPVPFPKSPQQILISVNGVIQEPDPSGSSGFNLVGTNIVFSSAPTNGHAFFGIIYATADYLNAGGNFPAGSLGAPSITFIGDENTGLYRKGGGSIGFVADATEIANTDSNGLTISSGNLIIPDSIIHNGDTNTKIRFPAADTVSVETGGSERLRITSNGNVAIGTANATATLEVINSSTGRSYSVSGATELVVERNGNSQIAIIAANDSDSIIHFGDTDDENRGLIGYDHANDSMRFRTADSVRATLDSSGNLGIGTTSPSANLHLKDGSGNTEIKLQGGASTANDVIAFLNSAGSTRGNITYDTDNDFVLFNVNTSERMRIDSSGRLLVGTTTEGFATYGDKFTIANSGHCGMTIRCGTSNDGNIYFSDGTSGVDEVRGFVEYKHSNNSLNLGTNGATRLSLDSSGNLLLGHSSARAVGGTSNRKFQIEDVDAEASISITRNSNNTSSGFLSFGKSRSSSNGGNTIVADNDILGTISFAGADGTNLESRAADIQAAVDGTPGENDMPGRLIFKTTPDGSVSPTERMQITSEGRVGIKTTSPDATLHVGGVISSHPVLLLEGGSSSTGDITVPSNENIQVGHWDSSSNTYTNRFQIDTSTGNVTMPTQACTVFENPNDRNMTESDNNDPIHFATQHINQGGMASSNSKSRITVPTTGTYLIQGCLSGSLSTSSAGDGIQIVVRRNGSVYPSTDMYPTEGMGVTTGEEYAFTFSLPLALTANDYVEITFTNIGSSIAFTLNRGYFAVTLLH